MRRSILFSVLAAGVALAACGLVPHRTAQNEAACPDRQELGAADHNPCVFDLAQGRLPEKRRVPRARDEFESSDGDVPAAFVGLSISGGGSRAANFGMAALEQLDQLGLLQHVTAISTTSGGGLPGAYYALKGPSIDWKDARERMATNFLKKWALRNLRPDKLVTTTFTHEDRSDLMAEIFDEVLFDKATYGALKALGPGRPIFLANATHAAHGTRFTFTQEAFAQRQRSFLDTYPLSHAVMASAAFPGVFNSVTLKRYPGPVQPTHAGRLPVPVGYDHLIDGGPADNLGIEALLALAASHQRSIKQLAPQRTTPAPCFFFVIDAYPDGVRNRTLWDADPRGILGHAIDLNFRDGFDALLAQRRGNLLALLGLGGRAEGRRGSYLGDVIQRIDVDDLPPLLIGPGLQMVDVDIPADFNPRVSDSLPILRVKRCRLGECPPGIAVGEAPPPASGYFRCTAWHINLSGLMTIASFVGEPGQPPQRTPNNEAGLEHPVMLQRARLQYVTNQIATNFRLAGPENCAPSLLQDVLYAAAYVTVREDHASRTKACEWFTAAGLTPSGQCLPFPGNRSLDVKLKLRSVGPSVAGRPGDTSVACVD